MMLGACTNMSSSHFTLSKEGIAPYELSESEKYILESFAIDDTSQILAFKAPKEAKSLQVNIYRLDDKGKWSNTGGGGVPLNPEQLSGTFTIHLKEDYGIDFNINTDGLASIKTEGVSLESESTSWTQGFLEEFQNIEMNKEIPVAFKVVDSGPSMEGYSLQDYFKPSGFKGMDLVQFVTIEFSDESF